MSRPGVGLTYAQLASLKPGHWVVLAHPTLVTPMRIQGVHTHLVGVADRGLMRWYQPWELELPTREELARIQLDGLGGL